MRTMKFEKSYLLSHAEGRARSLTFDKGATVIRAGNGCGKSALLKSLYDTFGAEPHRIDNNWRAANVISAVDFMIDGERRTIMKYAGTYTVFDGNSQKEFQTTSVSKELAPFFAELLDFRLLMTDQQDQVKIPPPSYAFAPYYIDQDEGWTAPWKSFRSMYLPRSAAALADYHSGLKPNAYYVAQAMRDSVTIRLKDAEARRREIASAMEHLKQIDDAPTIYFDLADFQAETEGLLTESQHLHNEQVKYRSKLSELMETRALWSAQIAITGAALGEFNEVFEKAAGHSLDVECPTCGEHYTNDIAARFNIAADTELLFGVLSHAKQQYRALETEIDAARSGIVQIEQSLTRVQAILSVRRNELSLGEVIAAEGRNVATRILRDRVAEVDAEIGSYSAQISELKEEMRRSIDKKRSQTIKDFFGTHLIDFSTRLDARIEDKPSGNISNMNLARGSEGPRGLAAYFYAFLHTVRGFGSSTFCPIIIDAPNQQGQDASHLPAIISFLVKTRPVGSQLILAVEDAVGIDVADAAIIDIGENRNQLLVDAEYEGVAKHLLPYMAQLI